MYRRGQRRADHLYDWPVTLCSSSVLPLFSRSSKSLEITSSLASCQSYFPTLSMMLLQLSWLWCFLNPRQRGCQILGQARNILFETPFSFLSSAHTQCRSGRKALERTFTESQLNLHVDSESPWTSCDLLDWPRSYEEASCGAKRTKYHMIYE